MHQCSPPRSSQPLTFSVNPDVGIDREHIKINSSRCPGEFEGEFAASIHDTTSRLSIEETLESASGTPIKIGSASVFSKNGCRDRNIMSEVGVADRTRLLRSKRAELSGIVTSRKRKLRELYTVCDNESPLPQIDLTNPDAPSTNISEARFLEVTDILQDRLFDESNLPTRRQLRSDKLKQTSPIRKASPDVRISDASRKAAKIQRDGRKSRAPTPSSRSDGGISTAPNENQLDGTIEKGTSMQRSTSKGSQTDLPVETSAVLNEIVEETFENAEQPAPSMSDTVVPPKDLESDRIRTRVESRPNSPGVDPRQAMPIAPEDAAQLPGPIVEGLGSHDGQHRAATVHLPPKEVQERHLQQVEKARQQREQQSHLSINPPRDAGRNAEALSSPGSTIDALSATTPAMHEASTDTSPENESRYDADRMDKDDEAATPPQLKPTPEEAAEKAEHDRILQARIEIARDEIMRSSPRPAEDQSRVEEPATSGQQVDESQQDTNQDQTADRLTKEASEVVDDAVEDQDEVMAVPNSSGDTSLNEPEQRGLSNVAAGKQPEVADSEEEQTPPADAMDVDTTTVKDSFESNTALESGPGTSPAVPQSTESQTKEIPDSQKSSATPTSSTPRRTPSTPAAPPLERMTTRVASGAMRHKSVSEILGETPKPGTSSSSERRTESESAGNSHTPSRSTTPQSPGARLRMLEKAKERSKLSTVVFAGRPSKPPSRDNALVTGGSPSQTLKDDYFMPLFLATASTGKSGVQPLDSLLATAHKTITTSNAYVPIHENQTAKVLKRIYNLQSSNKWALRQPKRSPEPIRQTTHWDLLLQEAKWMRTDFREEMKWKMTVARNLACACAEWVESSPEDRKLLQVKATPPKRHERNPSKDVEMGDASSQAGTNPTPELVASGDSDSPMEDFDEESGLYLLETVAPTAIFALQDDEVVCGLRRSPTTDKLLAELPMYGSPLRVPQSVLPTSDIDPDRFWRRPALPLSKYVEGRMELKFEGPPKKKSRFDYEEEDDDEDHVVFGEQGTKRPILPPEKTDVALFNPEHKHIRDRIHSSHQFRPPSEFPMPLQSFFENRMASQWTVDEDVELKTLVREYQYNWSLISSMLGSKSLWASGPERRTPWECFERWINLEGLPADMQKTHYFRAYSTRIDTANRNVMAQPSQVPPQPNANGQVQPAPRRRPTTSVRVERRRNNKHLTLVDAMRKLAKKRETNVQKQQHAAGMAAMRKANEPQHNNNRVPIQTPQQFSQLKAEREEQFRARMEELQRRQDAQRRAMMQQRVAPQNPQQQPPNGAAPRPPAAGAPANGSAQPNNQNLTVPGQNRPRPMPPQMAGQSIPNSMRVPQMVPPAQMQGQLPLPNPALDVGLVTRAHQISQHQQAILRQQQGQMNGQSPQMHNSPPRMNGMPQSGFNMPPNMMPPFNVNGVSTPPTNNHAPSPGPGQAGSPRMGQNLAAPGVSPVQILEMNFKQKYPQATPDQIMRLISDHLANTVKQQQQRQGLAQSAMNAAAGSSSGNGMPGMAGMGPAQGTPQLYAQMLRQQQENQQKAQQQAQQAANAVANGQNPSVSAGNAAQGHAHRASTGSAHSGK
ncbi:hypothetical protein EG329_007614 [Mollisiaceae sp. DMI_Dod_QoI]|nr:hypothetical protein EG329_007614 [Helotiales sp. DMI_Dod_QoI]